jgi:hypothetical protein
MPDMTTISVVTVWKMSRRFWPSQLETVVELLLSIMRGPYGSRADSLMNK